MKISHILSIAAGVFAATSASATIYDFTSTFDTGPNTGVLTGTVNLAFVGIAGTGSGSASNLTITSAPSGIPLPEGAVATSWSIQAANAFEVTAGDVTGYQFDALTGAGDADAVELCLNNGGPVSTTFRACPQNLNFLGTGNATQYGYNFNGSAGIKFTAESPGGAAPEPTTWSLMLVGLGLAGLGLRSHRRLLRA